MDEEELVNRIEKIQELLENGIKVQNALSTRVDKSTPTVSGDTDIIEIKNGNGVIDQILIQSPSSSFKIYIWIDDHIVFDENWTYFQTRSDYLLDYSAFLVGSTYYLNIQNLNFQKNIKVQIKLTSSSSITFTEILILSTIKEAEIINA